MAQGQADRFFPLGIYIVEGASCGGCALETAAALASPYAAARGGIHLVDAPAHADVLVLCGDMPSPLAEEVQRLARTLHAPWVCLQVGDCVTQEVGLERAEMIVSGCPPDPTEILTAIWAAWEARSMSPSPSTAPPPAEEGDHALG